MKQILLILSICAIASAGNAQKYTFSQVTGRTLDIPFTNTGLRTITRQGVWLHFAYNFDHSEGGGAGEQGFALKIIDSVLSYSEKRLTYVLDQHWITNFDSCYIGRDTIILFNHSLDFLRYTLK